MKHPSTRWLAAGLVVTALGAAATRSPAQEPAGPPGASQPIHESLVAQVAALNAEDPDAVMALFHPEAPGLDEIRRGLVAMFRARDHQYTLQQFTFVAEDGPYAYARCLQLTTAVGQDPASGRRVEQLFVFRRERANWKFWTSVVLREAGR